MEKEPWLMASTNSALQEINLREARATNLVEMIRSTDAEEWDLDLIERVYNLIIEGGFSHRFALAAVYQMGVIG
ncbi:MAG: hypothetical protein P4L59_19630 [Desulfosporosinus sp.]|nr:hypothetical protein [Desulfosporosinus sp.]